MRGPWEEQWAHLAEMTRPLNDEYHALRPLPVDAPDPEPEPKPEPKPEPRKPCCVKHLYARNRAERRAAMGSCRCRGECGHHGRAVPR